MAISETVREAFARQARYCDEHGSPLTARLLRGLTRAMLQAEPVLHAVAAWRGDPVADVLPLRVAGALHALVLQGAAPALARHYPGGDAAEDEDELRQAAILALQAHPAVLAQYLASPPQTNEVGRSAVLVGGFTSIAACTGLPVRLFELGASAGLNLAWDRYRYRLGGLQLGDAASPLELAPVWHGEPPPPTPVDVVARAACDLAPIDLSDAAQRERLRAYVWADQSERLRQLDIAMSLAAQHPYQVARADAVAWLERMLAAAWPQGVATVIYHTIFWTYLAPAAQRRLRTLIQEAGRRASAAAPLAWLRLEIDDFKRHPRLLLSLWPGPQDLHLADAQAHGREIFWHAGAAALRSLTAPRHGELPASLTINRFGVPR
jgi:hypothetical protein